MTAKMHGTDPGNYEKTAGEGRGASFSKSKNWFPICNNTHLSPPFDVFSPKGGKGKKESCFSPVALSPPRLTSLFFFPQKRLILRLERQSQKRSGEEKGTISPTIPPPPQLKRLKIDGLIQPTCFIQSIHGT